ncbi:unnamed protein product, partial [Brugia timori]|uniref:Ovule protein n=1 Tax=Brugia timori TaxID=42155 RepID=A0A0R3QHD2_9BILA
IDSNIAICSGYANRIPCSTFIHTLFRALNGQSGNVNSMTCLKFAPILLYWSIITKPFKNCWWITLYFNNKC